MWNTFGTAFWGTRRNVRWTFRGQGGLWDAAVRTPDRRYVWEGRRGTTRNEVWSDGRVGYADHTKCATTSYALFFASFGVETSYRRRSADVPVLRAFCVERGLFSRGVNLEKSFPNWISSLERRGKPVLLRSRFFHRDFEKITFGKTVSLIAVLERLFPNWKVSFQLTCESASVPAFDALFPAGCPKQSRPFGSSCSKRDVSAG